MDHHHCGGLSFDFRISHPAPHLSVPVADGNPFQMARRFLKAWLGPILAKGDATQAAQQGQGTEKKVCRHEVMGCGCGF
jgi:hypothetical protein